MWRRNTAHMSFFVHTAEFGKENLMRVKINVKKFSRKQNQVAQMEFSYSSGIKTVKDLLAETVTKMVEQYEKRMDSGEGLTVLTEQEIADKSSQGKIGFGVNYGEKRPDLKKSIESAWECFADGIVVLFIDGEQIEGLEEQLAGRLKEGSELTFVRMTPLAGRMW